MFFFCCCCGYGISLSLYWKKVTGGKIWRTTANQWFHHHLTLTMTYQYILWVTWIPPFLSQHTGICYFTSTRFSFYTNPPAEVDTLMCMTPQQAICTHELWVVEVPWHATWCDQFFCEYDHSKGRYISKAHMWSYFGAGYPHQLVVSTTISHTIWRCLRAAAVSSGYIQPCVRTCISDKGGSNWCLHEGLGDNGICAPSVFNLPSNIIIKWKPRRLLPLPTNGTCLCVPINLLHHQNCGGYG